MSSGGNPTTTQTQTSSIPQWLQDVAQGYLGSAQQVSQLPYAAYDGQRVADLSPVQQYGIQGIAGLAGGTQYTDAAANQLTNTLNGNYSNPYASQGVDSGGQYQFSPVVSGGMFNPSQISSAGRYNAQGVDAGSNPYMGDNPYFQRSLDKGTDDITRAYKNGTAAQTDAMFANAHAFGGSAYQEAVGNNERQLGDTLSNYVNSARQGQYDRSANLAESGLGRNLQAGQFNNTLGNQTFENAAQRGMQAQQLNNQFGQSAYQDAANRNLQAGQFNNTLGNQAFESAAQRGLNAGQFNANLGSQSYENERQRQLAAISGATGLYGAQGQAYNNALTAGNTERNQQQSLLDSQYQDFNDWRNYPAQQLGIYGNAMGNVMGRAGGSTTSSTEGPGPDRVSQGLGIATIGSVLGRGSGK